MKTLLYIVAVVVLLIVILSIVAPKSFNVSRKIEVEKNQEEVFAVLRSLKEQANWSPWADRDPNMKSEFRGMDGEIGSVNHWIGNKQVGEGEQEIIGLEPYNKIETELRFLKPWKATNIGYFLLKPTAFGTEVTWGFSGRSAFPMNIMMLFMNMDKTIGKDFEMGLYRFKSYIEKE